MANLLSRVPKRSQPGVATMVRTIYKQLSLEEVHAQADSTSPRYREKASYYSAVCLETGEVEWMVLEGNSNSESSVVFLDRLRHQHGGRLSVIWDNAPAHQGPAVRSYPETPDLRDPKPEPAAGQPRVKHGAGSARLQPGLQRR